MKKAISDTFIYPYWIKRLGLSLIFLAIVISLYRFYQYHILDLAGASFPIALGLVMIFFSREKIFDERIAYLKFKALAVGVPAGAVVVMLMNYAKNYNGYHIETDSWYSISAFEYLTIALTIAVGWFYYLKLKK